MNNSLKALETQYFFLQSSLPDLIGRGAPQAELDAVRSAIVQSRTNYWTAINKILHDDDPTVEQLTSEMNFEEMNLEAAIQNLDTVAEVLSVIAKAVDVGTKLAAQAIAL